MAKNNRCIRVAAAATLVALSLVTEAAFAVYEIEPNDTIDTPQPLVIGSGGTVEVSGALGSLSGALVNDFDFYSFEAKEGDVITVDIDGGQKPDGSTSRSVDTYIYIFGPCSASFKCAENDDADAVDPGSVSTVDSQIVNFRVEKTGTYIVAVTDFLRQLDEFGRPTSSSLGEFSNGSYTLIISGVSGTAVPPTQQISIDIKPWIRTIAPINPKSRDPIPVALLSSAEFNALEVDRSSLTFGAEGTEASFVRCGKEGRDVNGDGRPDLVCLFDNQVAGFEPGDLEGIVKGTNAGRPFEGRGRLKVVAEKRRNWRHGHGRHWHHHEQEHEHEHSARR